ncbi:MAG: hypothetical protein JJ863_30890 [Deltaproteobacteria bacterium]|nr:hypothetical protein [Deltaproteobacteria bacterium]
MRVTITCALLLSFGCFASHEPELEPSDLEVPDAAIDCRGPIDPWAIVGREWRVGQPSCGPAQDVTMSFVGRGSGRVDLRDPEPELRRALRIEARPVEPSRLTCWIDASSRFRVSDGDAVEIGMRCDDGVDRQAELTLRGCRGLTPEIAVSPSDHWDEWTLGCGPALWLPR